MLRNVLLSTAALSLVGTAAMAGNLHPQMTVSQDHRFVSVLPSKNDAKHVVPPARNRVGFLDHS